MKRIPLTQGKFALVDDEDYESLSRHKWYYCRAAHARTGYAYRMLGPRVGRIQVRMHGVLLSAPPGMQIDHRNRDGLDNRRSNLRLVTSTGQILNRGLNKNNTSGVKGVTWDRSKAKWAARIGVRYRTRHLGYFEDKCDAIQARRSAEALLHREVP
jgi:hypothetical protein